MSVYTYHTWVWVWVYLTHASFRQALLRARISCSRISQARSIYIYRLLSFQEHVFTCVETCDAEKARAVTRELSHARSLTRTLSRALSSHLISRARIRCSSSSQARSGMLICGVACCFTYFTCCFPCWLPLLSPQEHEFMCAQIGTYSGDGDREAGIMHARHRGGDIKRELTAEGAHTITLTEEGTESILRGTCSIKHT